MNKTEQTTYLCNIMHVAMADGFLDSSEVAFMERTRAAIGATKTTLKKAMKDLNALDLVSLARVSDRVRCLEDMLGCAIVEVGAEGVDEVLADGGGSGHGFWGAAVGRGFGFNAKTRRREDAKEFS